MTPFRPAAAEEGDGGGSAEADPGPAEATLCYSCYIILYHTMVYYTMLYHIIMLYGYMI